MESTVETDEEGGGRTASVCNVLLGSGPGSITFLGGDLGLIGGNVLEARESACGLPKADNAAEGKEAKEWTWRSEAEEKVIKESATQSLRAYIDKRQTTVAD